MTIRTTMGCILAATLTTAASAAPPPTALIALLGGNGIVSWEYPTHKVIPGFISFTGGIYTAGLATNAAGELLASHLSAGADSIRHFSPSAEELTPFISGGPLFRSLAVAPNEDVLAVSNSGATFTVRRYDSAGAYLNTPYTSPSNYWIEDVLVTPDGRGFALQHARSSPVVGSIEIFDPATGTLLGSIPMPAGTTPGTTRTARDMKLAPDGNIYFITGPNTSIYRVAPTPGALPFPIVEIPDSVSTFAIGPDGLIYAAVGQSITRYTLDGTNMGVFATYQGNAGITRLHFGNVVSAPSGDCLPPE